MQTFLIPVLSKTSTCCEEVNFHEMPEHHSKLSGVLVFLSNYSRFCWARWPWYRAANRSTNCLASLVGIYC